MFAFSLLSFCHECVGLAFVFTFSIEKRSKLMPVLLGFTMPDSVPGFRVFQDYGAVNDVLFFVS